MVRTQGEEVKGGEPVREVLACQRMLACPRSRCCAREGNGTNSRGALNGANSRGRIARWGASERGSIMPKGLGT